MLVFSHTFPLLWEFTFPLLLGLYGFLFHAKHVKNPYLWNTCVSPYFSHFPILREMHVFQLLRKYVRDTWPWNILFSHTFPALSNTTFLHVLGITLLMYRLIKNFHFRSYLHSIVYVKLFTKQANLFCCWAQSNIFISDPFVIEVWKYLRYRKVESIFYMSTSILTIFLWIRQFV